MKLSLISKVQVCSLKPATHILVSPKNNPKSSTLLPLLYAAIDGTCKYDSSKVVTKVNQYYSITGNEAALLEAVATEGPVSVGIDASYLSSYSSGIYSDSLCSPYGLNHGVLVVGYGSENGNDYWIIKNSWGTSWGEQGYFRLLRGVNECGVAEDNVYPVV